MTKLTENGRRQVHKLNSSKYILVTVIKLDHKSVSFNSAVLGIRFVLVELISTYNFFLIGFIVTGLLITGGNQ